MPSQVPTIQAGVNSAALGDTVLVAPGTYVGEGNRDVVFPTHDLVVRSEAGSAVTVLDIGATRLDPHRGFLLDKNELTSSTVLEGFTIINGYMGNRPGGPKPAAGDPGRQILHDLSAGGAKCLGGAPVLRDLVVRHCGSEYTGGGISIEAISDATLERCVIEGCYALQFGGGVSVETGSDATIRDCSIVGNHAIRGGGLNLAAFATIEGSLIAGNTATQWGGAIFGLNLSNMTFRRTILWGNCGEDGGGEIYLDLDSSISFACCLLDSTDIVHDATNTITWAGANVFTAPNFCYPLPCSQAPVLGGDYRLQLGSPCLASSSPCGERIGPLDAACPAQTAVLPTTWTRLKGLYRGSGP